MQATNTIEPQHPTRSRYARRSLVDAAVPHSAAHGFAANDANGNLISVQLVDNGELVDSNLQEYDLSDRQYRQIDAGGHALTTEFDPVGNPLTQVSGFGYWVIELLKIYSKSTHENFENGINGVAPSAACAATRNEQD